MLERRIMWTDGQSRWRLWRPRTLHVRHDFQLRIVRSKKPHRSEEKLISGDSGNKQKTPTSSYLWLNSSVIRFQIIILLSYNIKLTCKIVGTDYFSTKSVRHRRNRRVEKYNFTYFVIIFLRQLLALRACLTLYKPVVTRVGNGW